MVKKAMALVNFFLITALFLSGCGVMSSPDQIQPMLEKQPLKVEYTIWQGDYTLLIAQEKGFFEKHGVKVEPVFYETFSTAIPDLAVNRIDIGLFSIGDLLTVTSVANVKGIAVYDSGGVATVVSRSSIQDVTDLKGKRIGVNIGTTGEMLVREMLSQAGMSVSDVELVDANPEDVPQRLSDDLYAGYVWSPHDVRAVQAGHKILYTAASEQSLFPDVIVVRGNLANDRREDMRAFLDAWFEAVDYRLANPDECNQIIAEATGQTMEDLVYTSNIRIFNRSDNLGLFDQNDQNDSTIYHAARVNLDFLVMRGNLTQKPDISTILDPSFLQ